MKMRKLVILVIGFAAIAVGCGRKPAALVRTATPLAACQAMPPNLPEDLRRLYSQLCSTNIEQRNEGLRQFNLSPSEMASFLPLLSDIMATQDYIIGERGQPFYLGDHAANLMALAGSNAVPFIIKALQLKKGVEVYEGLKSAGRLADNLKWDAEHGIRETNEWRSVCVALLPYVTMWTTNTTPPEGGQTQPPYTIADAIQELATKAKRALQEILPPASSNE